MGAQSGVAVTAVMRLEVGMPSKNESGVNVTGSVTGKPFAPTSSDALARENGAAVESTRRASALPAFVHDEAIGVRSPIKRDPNASTLEVRIAPCAVSRRATTCGTSPAPVVVIVNVSS
jgi:hypothetical protein